MWRNSCMLLVKKNGAAAMENSMKILKELKVELPLDPAIPLLDIYPEENKSLYEKDTYTCMFTTVQ